MRRIGGCIIIIRMAAITGVWNCGVISVVAEVAIPGNGHVSALEYPVIIVDWEGGRCPSGIGGVAVVAIRRNACRDVIRVRRLVIGLLMTGITGIRCGGIIPVMAGIAVVCNGGMRTGKRIVIAMDGECGRGPSRIGGVACLAGVRNSKRYMVRVG